MSAAGILHKWYSVLRERVAERIGIACSPLALAMRILLCGQLSISTEASLIDIKSLLDSQSADGGWECGWLCGYPSTGANIQNVGLTTSMAVKALGLCTIGE